MKTDYTTKVLLFAIALGLWANALSSWLRSTPVAAQTKTTCAGALTANAYGGDNPSIGGYDMHFACN